MKKRIALVLWDDAVKAEKEWMEKPNVYTHKALVTTEKRLKMVDLATPRQLSMGGEK